MAAVQQPQQQQQQPPQQQQTMQLEFNQAMQDFKTMFPDMDSDVIEAVLRANQGAVDPSIDQLLAMTTDTEHEKVRAQLPDLLREQKTCNTTSLTSKHKWNPPLLGPLPPDFLRFSFAPPTGKDHKLMAELVQQRLAENQALRGEAGSQSDPELTQYLEDERIALFLQNREFMEELKRSRDFMTALEQDALESPGEEPLAHKGGHLDDAAFRERLRNMGKASRKKFAQMARMFNRSKKKGAKHILSRGEAPSRDHLLLTEEPLLVEEEEQFKSEPKGLDVVASTDSSFQRNKDAL